MTVALWFSDCFKAVSDMAGAKFNSKDGGTARFFYVTRFFYHKKKKFNTS